MKSSAHHKKVWEKPLVDRMNIKKDTFSGSGNASEKGNPGDKAKFPTATGSRGGR